MDVDLTISARNAGMAALKAYCPRCAWYLLKVKKFPFLFPMPGIMFFLEQCEKAFILAYLEKHGHLPKTFGPFCECTEPVDFPFRMRALPRETGVTVSAQVDLMLRNKDKTIALIDLKTAKSDGGGAVLHPQHEIQVIGYSWVTEEAEIGTVGSTGLIFCEVQQDAFKIDPLNFADEGGIQIPFAFKPHLVELDYKRFAKCLKEMKRVWEEPRPPKGAEGCKDCMLLSRLLDYEDNLRGADFMQVRIFPQYRDTFITIKYLRDLARGTPQRLKVILDNAEEHFDESGMVASWDFSDFS